MSLALAHTKAKEASAKLTTNEQSDLLEMDAKHLADKLTGMSALGPPPTPMQCKCEDCEEEQLQMKPISGNIAPMIQKSPDDLNVGTQGLHDDLGKKYSEETGTPYQEGIQYSPGYEKWLEASTPRTQWLPPVEVQVNPLERLKQHQSTAKTFLVINGTKVDGKTTPDLLKNMLKAITPVSVKSETTPDGKVKGRFDPVFKLDVGTELVVPTPPGNKGWKGKVNAPELGNPAACMGKTDIPTTLRGVPDHNSYHQLIRNSELEHVASLKELYTRHFVPYYNFVMGLSVTGSSEADCKTQLNQQLGKRPDQAAFGFVLGDVAETKRFDDPGSTHHGKMTVVDTGTNCNKVKMDGTQTNPQKPGLDPGNVKKIAPVVTAVNPSKLSVSGSDLLSDGKVILNFSSPANAASAMGIMTVHKITEIRSIGNFNIALSNGAAPILNVSGVSNLKFDPTLIQVTLGGPKYEDWFVTQVKGANLFELEKFGSKRDQAYSAVEILRQFGFTQKIWIGTGSNPDFSYYLKN